MHGGEEPMLGLDGGGVDEYLARIIVVIGDDLFPPISEKVGGETRVGFRTVDG